VTITVPVVIIPEPVGKETLAGVLREKPEEPTLPVVQIPVGEDDKDVGLRLKF